MLKLVGLALGLGVLAGIVYYVIRSTRQSEEYVIDTTVTDNQAS